MTIWKILHKPTGLYFTPNRGRGNLSKGGKLYTTPPSLTWCETLRLVLWRRGDHWGPRDLLIIEHWGLDPAPHFIDTYVNTPPEDWQIIAMDAN